ncbi:MAG: hypothetical protein KA436_09105 [Oligoflexales bacterium]|nr:hypothetical protein [Oligoflexales bacterium]
MLVIMNKNLKADKLEPNKQVHTVTGRFNNPLFLKMQEWLKQNGISANQLLAKAVERYISEAQILEPVDLRVASDDELSQVINKLMTEHKRALHELK